MTQRANELIRQGLAQWRESPAKFVWDIWGYELDKWQHKALQAYAGEPVSRVGLKSCAGPGKSFVEAVATHHHMTTNGTPEDHPVGAAVSCTRENLRDNLWREIAMLHSRSPLLKTLFRHTSDAYFRVDHPATWRFSARSFAKGANPEEQGRSLSGLHGKYVLVVIDEAGDMSPSVARAADQALAVCDIGRIIAAGNTTSLTGLVYHISTVMRERYVILSITGDPDNPERSPRVDINWAREQIETYGRDNPWVMAYVLGEFPPAGINALLSIHDVEESMKRNPPPETYKYAQKRIGVDVARYGDDRTVLFPRQGLMAYEPAVMRNADSNEVAARVVMAKAKWGSENEFIDGTGGYGAGVVDSMKNARYTPKSVDFSGKADDPRYRNKRDEMWFRMAEWVKQGGALPDVPGLVNELTAPTYSFVGGKFALEAKDQMKKRIGVSPDLADALALTFALAEMPSSMAEGLPKMQSVKVLSDFDPLETL